MNMGIMREISVEECNAVFGGTGEIVVSGRKPVPGSTNFAGTYGPVYNSSMLPAGIMGSYEDIYDPDGDDDGDGIRNMDEEIVVTADVTHDQIQAANLAAYRDLWIYGVISAPLLVLGGEVLATTLAQRLAAATVGAMAVPFSDAAANSFFESRFKANLDMIRNPEFYRPVAPY